MNKTIIRAIFGIAIAFGAASYVPKPSKAPATSEKGTQPHGYMIANYNNNNKETFQKYMDAAGNLAPKYNGAVTLFDFNAKTLEGNPKSVIGVAEFHSLADAKRFYNSPEYTAARKFRIASTEGSVLLAESSVYAKH